MYEVEKKVFKLSLGFKIHHFKIDFDLFVLSNRLLICPMGFDRIHLNIVSCSYHLSTKTSQNT